jgi:hypothetical protein
LRRDGQIRVYDFNEGFWSTATGRRFQKARHVAPFRVWSNPQALKKRRLAGALQEIISMD